jgi:HEPN domain-containing protein
VSDRSRDWLDQAKRDAEHAAKDVVDGYYEHACFEAQQAAGKAVKAVYMRRHSEAWGHRVALLLQELAAVTVDVPAETVDSGKLLDQYYIPTRYPNGFESGSPKDFFTREQASDAVRRAQSIIQWCEGLLGH